MSDITQPGFRSFFYPRPEGLSRNAYLSLLFTALSQGIAGLFFLLTILFAIDHQVTFLWIPFSVGLVFWGSGLWLFGHRRLRQPSHIFAIFTAFAAIGLTAGMQAGTAHPLILLGVFSFAVTAGALIHFTFVFPEKTNFFSRAAWLAWTPYIFAILLIGIALAAYWNGSGAEVLDFWRDFLGMVLILAVLVFIAAMVYHRLRTRSPATRQQTTIVLWGSFFSFSPAAVGFLIHLFSPGLTPLSPYFLLPIAIFPVSIVVASLYPRTLDIDFLLRQAVVYSLLSIIAASGYALLVSGFTFLFGERLPGNNPFTLGLMVFLLALLLNPIRNWLQAQIDRLFFRNQEVYQLIMDEFNQSLDPAMEMAEISLLLRDCLKKSIAPTQFHLFVLDTLRDRYLATADETGRASTDIQFAGDSPLPILISREGSYLYLSERTDLQESLLPERSRINLLASQLFIPLPGRANLINGFISLGPKQSGEPYTHLDLNMLKTLGDQAAMAIERAQVVTDLERRVDELNVLSRVAQGINVTLRFDDILELIYAQANRIIPCRDFFILLYNRENDFYYYAFYLEDDRRLLQFENKPITGDIDLALQVIRTGQRMITDDYTNTCLEHGIEPQVTGLSAWVGLPLNAGAETIGALSLGNRDLSIFYTQDQIDLLQAIADQAISAIVKAQLLEDSERNARQLNLLNEVSRSLTSTLDLPNLLNQILDNAMEIVNCEAGTLFLLQEDTGELVFEVVKGPVAAELKGKRLQPGHGHVGRVVATGAASIVNQARKTEGWEQKTDQQTGFQTRDLLIVPLVIQDRVIGVIELINRRDSLPFTHEDQDLLTAFASQAAIAMENARLYTLTDQQLADRVDELSVMQRIDRELNASLDVSRAMRITLDWAMRRSGAEAGLVGSVTENGVQIMADRGYSFELDPYRGTSLSIALPGIEKAIGNERTQQILRSEFQKLDQRSFNLLTDAQCQIIVPIRREERVIGLLLLESHRDTPWSEDTQEFLSRLTDHAAIAIANAELFTQVQEANIAKSEFVSFVSHELKTPMTSIRGYTDLLLGRAVGEINQAQENFLNTVRTNVSRMATLVSDLADVSRMEAGRLHMEFSAFSIDEAVQEVLRSQSANLGEKKHQLEIDIPEDLPPAWGDQARTVQILTNLVNNANKYTPPAGDIKISVSQAENQWDPNGAPVVLLVSVQDNGIGMSEDDQAQIFTKFFRSADPKAREVPGTGLGLNITRYLVDMQGGKIWFESVFRLGSTFHFTIPAAQV